MVKEPPKLMFATEDATRKVLVALKTVKCKTQNCRGMPKQIRDLAVLDVDADYHDGVRKIFVSFADM